MTGPRSRTRSLRGGGSHRDRAVATTLGYVLMLGMTMVLITGLLFGAGNFVEDQRERVIRTELGVIGQQIAADVQAGDRFVGANDTNFTISRDLPDEVVGTSYTVSVVVDDPAGYAPPPRETYLRLATTDPGVSVMVDMVVHSDIRESRFSGGTSVVDYDADAGTIEVHDG